MVHNAEHCRGANSGVGVAGPRRGGQQPSRACPHPGLGRCCRRNPVRCRADLFRGFVAGRSPLTAPAGVMPTPPAHERW